MYTHYICHTWSHCHQPCNKEHCIHDLHHWKYGCHAANIVHTTKIINWYQDLVFAYICHNTSNCNIYFTCYCQICARNKYATQIGHIPYILNIWWVYMGDICTYICHIWRRWHQTWKQKHSTQTTTTPTTPSDYRGWLGLQSITAKKEINPYLITSSFRFGRISGYVWLLSVFIILDMFFFFFFFFLMSIVAEMASVRFFFFFFLGNFFMVSVLFLKGSMEILSFTCVTYCAGTSAKPWTPLRFCVPEIIVVPGGSCVNPCCDPAGRMGARLDCDVAGRMIRCVVGALCAAGRLITCRGNITT